MSHMIPELSQIVDRLLVLAPDSEQLKEAFEQIHRELNAETAEAPPQAPVALPHGGPQPPVFQYWSSVTLGRRAGGVMRVSMVGATLEAIRSQPQVLGVGDGVFFFTSSPQPLAVMEVSVPQELRSRPWATWGLVDPEANEAEEPLELRAVREWFGRHLEYVRHVPRKRSLVREGLEWVLSFSS